MPPTPKPAPAPRPSAERRPQLVRIGHAPGAQTEDLGHLGVLGMAEIHRVETLVVAVSLAGLDPAEGIVGEDHEGDRQPEPHHRLQLAHRETEAAIPHQGHALCAGPAVVGTDGGRQGVAEGAVGPVGDEMPAGGGEFEVCRDVRTRGARISHDQGVAGQRGLKFGDHPLGPDRRRLALGELTEPGELLRLASGHLRGVEGASIAVGAASLQFPRQGCQAQAGVAHEGRLGLVVDADRGRVDVDVHHPHLVGRRMTPALGGDRAGAAADEDHRVGGVHQRPGLGRAAVAAHHPHRQRVAVGEASLTADGGRHGRVQGLGQGRELTLGARDDHPAAADEERVLGGADDLRRRPDLGRIGRHAPRRVGAERGIRPDLVGRHGLVLDIEGKAQMSGPGPARGHGREGRAQGPRDGGGAVDHLVPLGQGPEQRLLIELGQGEAAPRGDGDIGGDREHGHRGLVGLDDTRQDVGGAAAARPLADAHLAGDPGVGVGHVGRRALVPGEDMGDAVIEPVEGVVERQAGVAAEAEHDLDLVGLQHADDGLRASEVVGRHVRALQGWCAGPKRPPLGHAPP
jgi:hypothetical protein